MTNKRIRDVQERFPAFRGRYPFSDLGRRPKGAQLPYRRWENSFGYNGYMNARPRFFMILPHEQDGGL